MVPAWQCHIYERLYIEISQEAFDSGCRWNDKIMEMKVVSCTILAMRICAISPASEGLILRGFADLEAVSSSRLRQPI